MKLKIRQKMKLFLFIFIINTQFLQAHNSSNGGCNNHCAEPFLKNNLEKKLENNNNNNNNNNNQIKDNYSCLNKSLCRG